MRIVSNGDNLHKMLNPVFWKKIRQNIINLSCAQRVVKVKDRYGKKKSEGFLFLLGFGKGCGL